MRRSTLVALSALLLVAGCGQQGEVADFGPGAPGPDAPQLPADRELDLGQVEVADDLPPSDAVLADAGWAEVAGWIRREVEAGRPVLVNLFASWCDPCERELPLLVDAANATDDIAFLGVAHQDQRGNAQTLIDDADVAFPTLYDPFGQTAPEVGARGMPTTLVFDRDGRLAGRVMGELTEESLGQLLDEVR
ncbi:MAG: TlpA disulfide reductase family protein [Nitriliruptor sp.]|uniref:TlpA family protein disulfide reductase n=1 Tax=Nitriliruptor sp. TaxID=2448056 RepID=UPI0034A089DC